MQYENMTKEELIKQCKNKDEDNSALSKYIEYVEKSIINILKEGKNE